jgi:hypothetical protein
MLFWIAAIGSTWGAYALGFERLIATPDRTEAEQWGTQKGDDDRPTRAVARTDR